MSECRHCKFWEHSDIHQEGKIYNYRGDDLEFLKDGINIEENNLEIGVVDNVDEDCFTLSICTDFIQASIKIKFCPMCGRELK